MKDLTSLTSVPPTLEGGLLTTGPSGRPQSVCLKEIFRPCSGVTVPCCIPIRSVCEVWFLHTLTCSWCGDSDDNCCDRRVVTPHCGLSLYFSDGSLQ